MTETNLTIEPQHLSGVVAVGSYLRDAAQRVGARWAACLPEDGQHDCLVKIVEGQGLLSSRTSAEEEYFEDRPGNITNRLACQARIERPGEIVIMTEKKESDTTVETPKEVIDDSYRKAFAELPLEKKIANLVRLEAITFSETITFVLNSPFNVADKLMGVLAEFGFKKEEEEKAATRPKEHKEKNNAGEKRSKRSTTPRKRTSRKKPEQDL
jgi:ferredoxin